MKELPIKIKDLIPTNGGLHNLPKEIRSVGQKAADALTTFCGSWFFIIFVLIFIAIWVIINLTAYELRWDPWPFQLLNLAFACMAALQAPIILMSQNRQVQRDRISQRYDYLVDRKTGRDVENALKEIKALKITLERIEQQHCKKD